MRWRTPVTASLTACLLLAAPLQAQIPPADLELLEKVAATYKGLKRYLFEGEIQIELRSQTRPAGQRAPFRVAADGQGRVRDEVTGGPAAGMFLSDGREYWIYNGQVGQYVHRPGGADSLFAKYPNKGVGGALIARFGNVASSVTRVTRRPNETLTVDGAKHDCVVLEVSYIPGQHQARITEEPRVLWIDPATHLVLRQRSLLRAESPQFGGKVEQEESIVLTRAKLDPTLSDSLWVFRAPPGAREVADFDAGRADPGAAFTGKPAIDFTLKDLKGRAHSLKSLRGKVVLLDFWATWCGPCRITMPQVDKIHREYANRGVEVMSINVGETPKKAGDYMTKNGYAFTTLLDQDRAVSTQYRIDGIPTLVVIDPAGTVTDYLVGARDDVALRAALKKAGVK
jgi:thiol-disulfide isomerase/thioredoxin